MPMTEEERDTRFDEMSKEELIELAGDGIDLVWQLVDRMIDVGIAIKMPKEIIREMVFMEDRPEIFERVWEDHQDTARKLDDATKILQDLFARIKEARKNGDHPESDNDLGD